MKEPKTVGVIVGRFQTPYLHAGHTSLIENVLSRHDKVAIVLGVSGAVLTKKNPLDFNARYAMINKAYPQVDILSLMDMPSDYQWSKELDTLLSIAYPDMQPILYGNRDSFIFSYHGDYEYRRLSETVQASATDLRMVKAPLYSEDFREGMIYASHLSYPTAYQTVDIAVRHKNRILLGSKYIDEGKLRFIGGFVDPSDASLEAAARREVSEEAGMIETARYRYVGSSKIDDHRYRGSEHGIMSALFVADYIFGAPVAGDDLDDCAWVDIDHVIGRLVEQHRPLGEMLLDYLRKDI